MRAGTLLWGCVLFFSLILVSCSKNPPPPQQITSATFSLSPFSDEELVWQNATLAVPVRGTVGSMITTNDQGLAMWRLAGVKPKTRWPVIVMIAGCETPISTILMRALAEQGFIALSLESSARRQQPIACDRAADIPTRAAQIISSKTAELSYALGALQNMPWADQGNIFLLGDNEAGAAVALASGRPSKARILVNWNCEGTDTTRGLRDEAISPIFVVTSATLRPRPAGTCASYMQAGGESQNLTLPDTYSQDALMEPIVFTQLLHFLDQQLFK